MSRLIDFTDKAIMRMLLDIVQQLNPWIRIGEQMTAPTAEVCDGKLVKDEDLAIPDNLVTLRNVSFNVAPKVSERKQAVAGTFKTNLSDIENFRAAAFKQLDFHLKGPAYIYPYTLDIPSRAWLEKYKVGDKVSVPYVDPNSFQTSYVEVTLTQQMIDDNSDVLFRFAITD